MTTRRSTAILCAFALAFTISGTTLAEQPTGSGILNEVYAYVDADQAYFVIGRPVTFRVVMPDGPDGYTYEFTLFHTPDQRTQATFDGIDRQAASLKAAYIYTPSTAGQYLLEVIARDKTGQSLTLQTQPFSAYTEAAESDPDTLPGRVKAIAAELSGQALPTQYGRALWLHDWLTGHARYDESLTIHAPEGVLLEGTGVCESYALAYDILLHEAGIESIYMTGTSRGALHAWNLVQLDGEWTYIDPTWDDPVGGAENHDYFGLTDVLIARDHDASSAKLVPPRATTLTHNWALRNGVPAFHDETGLYTILTEGLRAQLAVVPYVYHGLAPDMDINALVERWMGENYSRYFVTAYAYGGSRFSGQVTPTYGDFSAYHTFANRDEFTALMDKMLNASKPLIQAYYTGDDPWFDFGVLVGSWFDEYGEDYPIHSISYNYHPLYGDISVTYRK